MAKSLDFVKALKEYSEKEKNIIIQRNKSISNANIFGNILKRVSNTTL